jgi:plastocyanin
MRLKVFRLYGPAAARLFRLAWSATLSISLLVVGCKQEPTTLSGPIAQKRQATVTQHIDPSMVGSVSGTVTFAGAAPKRAAIDVGYDPACSYAVKEPNFSEGVVVNNGTLANAFVYVKQGAEKFAVSPPAEPAILDQKGCRYEPHVMGLVAGQELRILNSDPAMHNVHPTAKNNESWNVSQMPGAAPIEKTFEKEELMLPIVCNQHPWMKMYVNILQHPFFAVSDSQGKFEIKGLPPGEYTLAVIHEKLGPAQEVQVKLAPKQAKQGVQFTYASK